MTCGNRECTYWFNNWSISMTILVIRGRVLLGFSLKRCNCMEIFEKTKPTRYNVHMSLEFSKSKNTLRWAPKIYHWSKNYHHHCVYISKINIYLAMWMKRFFNLYQQNLDLHTFYIQYSNVTFFDALEPPFTCPQENIKIWPAS